MQKILFLSWKDILHPEVWWAEVVLWNYIKWLHHKWYEVTWVWSNFTWGKSNEIHEWVNIIRLWTINNIYFKFPSYYKKQLAWKYDLIVDEAWWMPLFSPLYEKNIPIVFFIHHIWDKEWDFKYPFPLSKIGKFLFTQIIKLYKNHPTVTVSHSTKQELISSLWFNKGNVYDIENALDLQKDNSIVLENKKNEILFFGRLMPMKRAEHAILAFSHFLSLNKSNNSPIPEHTLIIIWPSQDEKYFSSLTSLVSTLRIKDKVIFHWWISLGERYKIADKKVMLFPSYKEWYWLVVLEANLYWIPSIWYDVWWVRDAIKDSINGHIVTPHDYKAMWQKLFDLLWNDKAYKNLSLSSQKHVKNHVTWEDNINKFETLIKSFYESSNT